MTAHKIPATLHHRGPDDGGIWVGATVGIALGHRRLSISTCHLRVISR